MKYSLILFTSSFCLLILSTGCMEAPASKMTTIAADKILFNTLTNSNSPVGITVSGNKVGMLTAKSNDSAGVADSSIAYQWFADGQSIDGATQSTYKLTSNEAGNKITVAAMHIDKSGLTQTKISDSNANIYIPKPTTALVVDVTDYGAKGNGRTNDTESIQSAIDFVAGKGGGTVLIPDGNYLIDTVSTIRMRSNVTVKMEDDAVVEGIPNSAENFYVFLFKDVENAHLIGGTIVGDRYDHIGTRGDYGMGVGILGSQNITVENVDIKDSWGDGVYIGDSKGKSEDIIIFNVVSDNNRRQGITIVDGDGIHIINSVFMNTNGADPSAGIDIEPDDNNFVTNVDILSSKFLNNQGNGIVISERVSGTNNEITNILVDGNEVTGNTLNILINGVTNGKITNNIVDGVGSAFSADGRVLTSIALDEGTSNIEITGNTVVTDGNQLRLADIDDRGQGNEVYDNVVTGTAGNNSLKGGLGDDTLKGGAGDDFLFGGKGRETLFGGTGSDTFVFNRKLNATNVDTVTDFSTNEDDKIGLSKMIFGDLNMDSLEGNWFITDGERADANTRIIQKGDNLYFDADGSGTAFAKVRFATVNQVLTIDDFVIVK